MSENKKSFNSLIENKSFEEEGKKKLDKREILNELFFIRRQIDTLIEAVYELGVTDGQNEDYKEASLKLIESINKDEKLPKRVDEIERKEFIVSEDELNKFTFDGFDDTPKKENELSENDKEWSAALDEEFPFEPPENFDAPTEEEIQASLEEMRKEWENLPLPDDEQGDNNE